MPLPLYVDMDGTLLATDSLWESLLLLLKHHPRTLWQLPVWLLRGKAGFKAMLATMVAVDVEVLPYRRSVVALIEERRQRGANVVLATAAHERVARAVADHLGCFDDVLASTEECNLSGSNKAEAIQAHARGAFGYIGNDEMDVPIWRLAEERLVVVPRVRGAARLQVAVGQPFQQVFEDQLDGPVRLFLRAMRVHQWAKNILLFIPLVLAHRVTEPGVWGRALLAFSAFSLTASSIYLLNDLLDLSADRRHPYKRTRPMASGALPIPWALLGASVFLAVALSVAWTLLSPTFFVILLGYIGATLVYSFALKRLPVVDVLMLAFFYVYRLVAGAVATGVVLTPWLLAFAAFLFVSLGCLKRVSELVLHQKEKMVEKLHGRGYLLDDLALVMMFGVNAGFLSTLVLALYINSQEVVTLYHRPELLWGVVIVLLYWLMRVWLLASRGVVHDDPVLFAIRDRVSRMAAFLAFICLLFAV